MFGVKKSKFANHLKRALPKFRGDRSEVRGVTGRSKFVAASAGRAERKKPDLAGERKAHLAEHVRNSCGQNNLEDMFHEHREPSQAFKPKRDILK